MSIIIKKMETEEEIRGKAFVHWRSWQEAYSGIVDQRFLEELTLKKCESIAFRWTENIIIAKDGERVIGFVGYGKYRDGELGSAGEIIAIYVLSEYYGRGIGYQLMQTALAQLQDYPQVAVWVLKENERAVRFYERCGFRSDRREEPLQLGTPVTEIRMQLTRMK